MNKTITATKQKALCIDGDFTGIISSSEGHHYKYFPAEGKSYEVEYIKKFKDQLLAVTSVNCGTFPDGNIVLFASFRFILLGGPDERDIINNYNI